MKQFLITLGGVFTGLLLFFIGLPLLLITLLAGAAEPEGVPQRSVLVLDLREGLSDASPSGAFAALSGPSLSVMSVVTAMNQAEDDQRIKGLLIRLPEGGIAPASAEELRLAIKSFQRSGKRVVAHSQGLYPSGVVVASYMLGASADEFWMQDTASFQVTGLSNEEVFLKGLFDRFGVVPDFQQRHEYKNAPNQYLQPTFTPEHREATLSWMTSVYESAVAQAAEDRRQTPQAIRAALETAPLSAREAQDARLIDRLGHWETAKESLLDRAGEDAETVEFEDYASMVGYDGEESGEPVVAVIEAEGAIMTGEGSNDPFAGGGGVFSDDIAEAIYEAVEDDDVEAIVLRVSSPGGSDTASDQILAAVVAAKKAGKPVVVSMGTYAASGGYWIASKASSIVAHPSTLTGSIGVFGGKLAIGPALERYGVNLESVEVGGAYTGAFDAGEPFNQAQRAEFGQWMDRIYQGFLLRVAEGRNLSPERVNEIARGRVWTGAQARGLGLVDELGGFYQAVAVAKRLAKIDAETDVTLRRMPGEPDFFEALSELFGVSATSVRTLAAAGWLLGDPRAEAIMDELAEARLRAGGGTVLEGVRVD